MFEIKIDVPFVFNRIESSEIINRLYDLCLSAEPSLLKLEKDIMWRDIEGSETTARYSNYNVFLIKDPVVKHVYDLIKLSYYEMLDALKKPRESMFIQCWINVHRKGQNLAKHSHRFPMHGHLTVNAHQTATIYGDNDELTIPNENGLLTLLGASNVMHSVTPYKLAQGARVSIAFDLLPEAWIGKDLYWRKIYEDRIFIPFD